MKRPSSATHTHTHMHGTHARSRHIDRALPRFHAKETISNAEFIATTLQNSSRLDSRYNSSPLFNKNQKKKVTGRLLLGGPPTNRGFNRIRICISRFPVLSRPGASILSFRRTRLRPSRSTRIDRRARAPCLKTRRQSVELPIHAKIKINSPRDDHVPVHCAALVPDPVRYVRRE